MDCSLPGSSVHGIFQARVLEWGAIAYASSILRLLDVYMKVKPEKYIADNAPQACPSERKKLPKKEKGIIILYFYYNHDLYGAGLASRISV